MTAKLQDYRPPTKIVLALAWASMMFLYVYNDYISMYTPGNVEAMLEHRMGPLGPATETILVAVSMLMAVPALMIVLAAALPSTLSRWLNVAIGVVYTAINALTLTNPHLFYKIVVGLEIGVSVFIVWTAFRWPRQSA